MSTARPPRSTERSTPAADPAPRRGCTPLPRWLLQDLRTDHAGETGAVAIYLGVLAVAREPALRRFAQRHLQTERRHLALIEALLPPPQRSRLLPLWWLAGWLTGALPACAGPRAVYATIEAVEAFVDRHYAGQLARIDASPAATARALAPLREQLAPCRLDEVAHRDEAAARRGPPPRGLLAAWCALVGRGSAWAVAICRHL